MVVCGRLGYYQGVAIDYWRIQAMGGGGGGGGGGEGCSWPQTV